MGGHEPNRRGGDFRAARIGAAAALTAALVLLIVVDAIDRTYDPSVFVLSLLVGGILTLLGIEAGSWLKGGRG